jgi:hypothetical protein
VSDVSERKAVINEKAKDEVVLAFPPSHEDLTRLLMSGMKVREVTISVKEGRQRAQFMGTERFASENVDMRPSWEDYERLKAAYPDRVAELNAAFSEGMTRRIMQVENYLYERIVHMQKKDNLMTWERDPKNPYVANPYNYKDALEAADSKIWSGSAR